MKLAVLITFLSFLIVIHADSNMNGEYVISNPNYASKTQFPTDYTKRNNIKYFDVYSPPI